MCCLMKNNGLYLEAKTWSMNTYPGVPELWIIYLHLQKKRCSETVYTIFWFVFADTSPLFGENSKRRQVSGTGCTLTLTMAHVQSSLGPLKELGWTERRYYLKWTMIPNRGWSQCMFKNKTIGWNPLKNYKMVT